MFIGGTLIRRFDGFRRLCRHSALNLGTELYIPDGDMLLCNRVLAALGGPPAAQEVRGALAGDGLAVLLLFLLTQDLPCRAGLLGHPDPILTRIKSLVHLLGHGVYPTLTGSDPLPFQEVVRELGPSGVVLKPLLRYDETGEPVEALPAGGAGAVRVGSEGGPYTLAVLQGSGTGLAPLGAAGGPMHPAVLILE